MMEKTFAMIVSIIPILLITYFIYKSDWIEKEPPYLLLSLFICGVFSCLFSLSVNILIKNVFPFLYQPYTKLSFVQASIKIFILTAFIEEFFKWFGSYIITWKNKHFNELYDAIIYTSFTSIGFAALENILYATTQYQNLISIILRNIISVPCHIVFAIFMGYYLGYAKKCHIKKQHKKACLFKLESILIPTILHATYDIIIIYQDFTSSLLLIIYLITVYLLSYIKMTKLMKLKVQSS